MENFFRLSVFAHGAGSHSDLVTQLVNQGLIKTAVVEKAFRAVDRAWFVPRSVAAEQYEDHPLPIGYNVTISAPHMHAMMAELMWGPDGIEGKRVLDVGSGTGYLTAVLACLVGPTGAAVGVEHVPQLVASSTEVCNQHFPEWMAEKRLQIVKGDGQSGCLIFPQYDAIHVGAAAATVPKALLDQLSPGGRLIIPVGVGVQDLKIITKSQDGQSFKEQTNSQCRFVPLTSLDHQLKGAF